MSRWFYHIIEDIENETQESDSLAKMSSYLITCANDSKLNVNLVAFTKQFVMNSFKPVLGLLCQRHFNDIYCGNVDQNCFTESDNSSLKRDPTGPQANAKLPSSAQAILNHTHRRVDKLQKEAMKGFTYRRLPKRDDSVYELVMASLSEYIVEHKSKLAVEQYEHSRCE